MKLNIGSHNKRIEGFVNLDILPLPDVDIVFDATVVPYAGRNGLVFEAAGSVEEIVSQEFLEHIGFRELPGVLGEWLRLLKPNGIVTVQTPNIESMCKIMDRQCECVPRKADGMENYKADPECDLCAGRALIHPERWRFAFTGAQKHEYDFHKNIFTPRSMGDALDAAGFVEVVDRSNLYKVIMTARKPAL